MSRRVLDMSPGRLSGYPTSPGGTHLVTIEEHLVDLSEFSAADQSAMSAHGFKAIHPKPKDYDDEDGWA